MCTKIIDLEGGNEYKEGFFRCISQGSEYMRLTLRLTAKSFFLDADLDTRYNINFLFHFIFNTINKKPLFKYVEYLKGN